MELIMENIEDKVKSYVDEIAQMDPSVDRTLIEARVREIFQIEETIEINKKAARKNMIINSKK